MPAPTHSPFRLPHSCKTLVFNRQIVLGQGVHSTVLLGRYGDREVAVKRIESKPSLTEDEFIHHKKLNHENVVKLLAVSHDSNFRNIALELCCATLFQVIKNTYNGAELPTDREVLYQIADGLEYIHSQNLVHFDIKPKNILISLKGQMKLADFGLCKETNIEGICILSGPIRGTFPWMAPEVYPEVYQEGMSVAVSTMADVFSCGCVFLVFLSRKDGGIHPFGNCWRSRETTQSNIRKGKQENVKNLEHLPYANLILRMIKNEPENRASLEELKNNLRDPASSSSIPNNANTSTFHQAQQEETLARPHHLAQEEPHPSFESHEMMEETNNKQKVPNKLEVELTFLQSPRCSTNGHSNNDRMERDLDADEADSDGSVKVGTPTKSSQQEPRQVDGNDLEQAQAQPSTSALSGCNSLPSANGVVKPELKQKVLTKEDVRKVLLNVSDEQETRDPQESSESQRPVEYH